MSTIFNNNYTMVVMLLTFLTNLGGIEGANCPALVYGDTVNTITASCTFLPLAASCYNGDAKNGQLITGPAAKVCIPASTNAACTAISAPANQAACDPKSIGTCAGGGGAQCTNVANGPEATCVATMDDTAGGATPCAWTSTNLCTYAHLTNNHVLKISGPVAGDFKVEVRSC